MTPTLFGRIQTRVMLTALVGVTWSAAIAALLDAGDGYAATLEQLLIAVGLFAILGVVIWEPLYHGCQQFRWEKDWPIAFGLLTFVPEAAIVWFLRRDNVDTGRFLVHAVTTWLLIWLVANGPLRIALLRWRFRGGRMIGGRW